MRTLRLMMALLPCFLIISCGGGNGPGGATVSGRSVDGYIQGASIYIVPVGETTPAKAVAGPVTTDSEGRFKLTGVSPAIASSLSYQLLSVGGTDSATGVALPSDTVYMAPMGADVVTPLTTLVMETARLIAGSGGVTQSAIDQAVANIASVAGMDANAILKDDPIAQGMNDPNTLKSLALNTTLVQLDRQNVMTSSSGSFIDTIDAIANELTNSSSLPQDVVSLMTLAALSDSTSQAKAEIITAGIHQGMMRMFQTYNAGPTAQDAGSRSIASVMQARIHSFLNRTGGMSTDVVAEINDLSNTIASGAMSAMFSNITTAANIGNTTVADFIRDAAGSNGLADLLGSDVRKIPWAGSVQPSAVISRIARVASVARGRAATTAAASDNPCAGQGNLPATWGCSSLFDSTTCSNATGTFEWRFTCSNNSPTGSTMILSNFNAMGMPLTGSIDVNGNTMTFTNLTNGTSTFDGSIGLASLFDGSYQLSVLDTLKVTGPSTATSGWKTLTLDSFSRAKMIPTDTLGKNELNVFLSGTGTRAGSANSITLALNYDRIQDAVKTPPTGSSSDYSDNARIQLSGIVSDGTDTVSLTNFGFDETRYFAAALDDAYLYKVSSFIPGSMVSTSRYGYAYFRGSNITFNPDGTVPSNQNGRLSLSTTR